MKTPMELHAADFSDKQEITSFKRASAISFQWLYEKYQMRCWGNEHPNRIVMSSNTFSFLFQRGNGGGVATCNRARIETREDVPHCAVWFINDNWPYDPRFTGCEIIGAPDQNS